MPSLKASSATPNSATPKQAAGIPGIERGASPAANAAPAAAVVPGLAVSPAVSGGFSYPTPFTRFQVSTPEYKQYPDSAVGKLFFNQNGASYVCSASAVGPTEIWTAGHCVHAGNNSSTGWSTNVVFIPSYNNGAKPFGKFSCNSLTTWSSWYSSGDSHFDVGSAKCSLNSKGENFLSRTGYLGFAWNQAYELHFDDFGYPQASPFNGATMQTCQSSFGHLDPFISGSGPTPYAIGCDMTGGSSGGPFIWQYGSGNYVNGHNDYKYTTPSQPLEMYSPYFGNEAKAVKDAEAS
jgi:V8-like Glu-specific endopeptidase